MTDHASPGKASLPASVKSYARYLLIMAGLGGLLYGVDVGIIAAALPYIEQTSTYNPAQLSQVVAAVLFGSVLSSLFAGMLSDIFGRKAIIAAAAALFTLSIPVICFSNDTFGILVLGRLLQGASAGLIGVVVPLYLAECLGADSRGKGTGMFQFLLTVGLVFAALIGLFTGLHVESVESTPGIAETAVRETKVFAWQMIFWVSMIPGIILFIGSFRLSESPRWLFRKGRKEEAFASLARNNGEEKAKEILDEMTHAEEEDKKAAAELKAQQKSGESLLQRKYVYPFVLAVLVLAFTQATGINSVLNYSVKVFQQAGLEGTMGNYGDVIIKLVNCLMTIVAVSLVDKKGRKFLLKLGTSGIIVGLMGVGFLFYNVEKERQDVTDVIAQYAAAQPAKNAVELERMRTLKESIGNDGLIKELASNPVDKKEKIQALNLTPDNEKLLDKLIANPDLKPEKMKDVEIALDDPAFRAALGIPAEADAEKLQLIVTYEQTGINPVWYGAAVGEGANLAVSGFVKKEKKEENGQQVETVSPATFTLDYTPDPDAAADGSIPKKLHIIKAELGEKPGSAVGWGVAAFFVIFIAFYATGPGVCVWLALSELMPSRIRSNGMAIALLINQTVSTVIAGTFLPWVGSVGYSGVFFTLGGITVLYFLTVTFFLPETKGRTLEEIEEYFTTGKMPPERTQG